MDNMASDMKPHTSDSPERKPVDRTKLLCFDELPPWKQDNECILSGYRPVSGSWKHCIESIYTWHNETINIHSHAIGAAIFAILPFYFLNTYYPSFTDAQPIDAIIFFVYCGGVASCFACSTVYHTIVSHSQSVSCLGQRIDCCGIVVLMWSASIASIHFAFICDPWLRGFHWFLTTISGVGCITFILTPMFVKPAFRTARALTYGSLFLFSAVFVLHGVYLYGFTLQRRRLALDWMVLMGFLNMIGATAYALRFPEAKFPYRFDFCGASHQVMHVAVLAAAVVHFKGLTAAFTEVRGLGNVC